MEISTPRSNALNMFVQLIIFWIIHCKNICTDLRLFKVNLKDQGDLIINLICFRDYVFIRFKKVVLSFFISFFHTHTLRFIGQF